MPISGRGVRAVGGIREITQAAEGQRNARSPQTQRLAPEARAIPWLSPKPMERVTCRSRFDRADENGPAHEVAAVCRRKGRALLLGDYAVVARGQLIRAFVREIEFSPLLPRRGHPNDLPVNQVRGGLDEVSPGLIR